LIDRLRELAGGLHQGREEEIADRVADNSRTLVEPVLQQLLELRIAVSEREKAVARVPWGQDPIFLPQPTRAPAIVGHGHDAGDGVRIGFTLLVGELRKPLEDGWKPSSAAERDDVMRSRRVDVGPRRVSPACSRSGASFVANGKSHVTASEGNPRAYLFSLAIFSKMAQGVLSAH
jgi:hypothetical protein